MTTVIPGNRLEEVLKNNLTDALWREKVDLSEETEAYVVFTLMDFIRKKPSNKTYIERLFEARRSGDVSLLIDLGNHILVFLGFFPEYFERRGNRISYYMSLGSDIFAEAYERTKAMPFSEISEEFPGILMAIRTVPGIRQDNSEKYWRRIEGLIQ